MLENMIPWERDIHISLLIQYLEEKRQKEEALTAQMGMING